MSDAVGDCDVCIGDGRYPIHNKHGREVYTIECPECCGTGEAAEEDPEEVAAREAEQAVERARATYDALPRDPVSGRPVIA